MSALKYHVDNSVVHLVIDGPPGNPMDLKFFEELRDFCLMDHRSLSVKGLVVYGAGRHFSSGAVLQDIISLSSNTGSPESASELYLHSEYFSYIEQLPYPTVAAITGCCLGSGLELALACKYRVATEHAVVGLPETGYGLIPGCGGTIRLVERVGRAKAIEMVLTGSRLMADEALEVGLVDIVVPRQELMNKTMQLIECAVFG